MMNERGFTLAETILTITLICACFIFLIPGLANVRANREIEALRIERLALDKAIRQCYAIEGSFPGSLEYLERYYGLSVDRNRFEYVFSISPGGDSYVLEILKR